MSKGVQNTHSKEAVSFHLMDNAKRPRARVVGNDKDSIRFLRDAEIVLPGEERPRRMVRIATSK